VITLLLAINIGVFIRADDEVDRHMTENFEKYQQRIMEIESECEQQLAYMKANTDMAKGMIDKLSSKTKKPT
jgi:hypothetical protein